jgi:predicted ribosome-associated RNA-binding protein Tma20
VINVTMAAISSQKVNDSSRGKAIRLVPIISGTK